MTEKDNVNFAVAVKTMKENLLAHIEYVQLNARIQRAKYDALLKEGFTEQQALELCK